MPAATDGTCLCTWVSVLKINCLACTLQKFYTKNHCDDEDDGDVCVCVLRCAVLCAGEVKQQRCEMWANKIHWYRSKHKHISVSFLLYPFSNSLIFLRTLLHSNRFSLPKSGVVCVCVCEGGMYHPHGFVVVTDIVVFVVAVDNDDDGDGDGDNINGSTLVLKFLSCFYWDLCSARNTMRTVCTQLGCAFATHTHTCTNIYIYIHMCFVHIIFMFESFHFVHHMWCAIRAIPFAFQTLFFSHPVQIHAQFVEPMKYGRWSHTFCQTG